MKRIKSEDRNLFINKLSIHFFYSVFLLSELFEGNSSNGVHKHTIPNFIKFVKVIIVFIYVYIYICFMYRKRLISIDIKMYEYTNVRY